MSRITLLEPADADPKARPLLEAARRTMGMIPNLLKGLAHSPVALDAYLSLSSTLDGGSLSPALREQIALATAGANACEYCASAHAALAGQLKLEPGERRRNLAGESTDPATASVLAFVRSMIEKRGHVSDTELQAVRDAGFSDGQIGEIVAAVALNTLTNYFNGVAQTPVDFPRVDLPEPAVTRVS